MHNRKLVRLRRKKVSKINPKSKLFFNEYLEEMLERISAINETFHECVVYDFRNLNFQKPENMGNIIRCDSNVSASTNLVYDEEFLPFKRESVDMILSFFNLHFANDVQGIFHQVLQSLKPNGIFLACLFAGDTLAELRFALSKAEEEIVNGASPRISPFADLQGLSNLLQKNNFSLPVADIDRKKILYNKPIDLMLDLRLMGETNSLIKMKKNFMRRDVLKRAIQIYEDNFTNDKGKIYATFEIAWVIGWKYHHSQQKPLRPGSGEVNLKREIKKFE